jgi:hypothetical protein
MESPPRFDHYAIDHDTPEYWYSNVSSRVLWNLPITAVLMVLIIILMLRSTAQDAHQNLQKSRAELAALAPPPVKDEDNAAIPIMKAMASWTKFIGPSKDEPQNILSYPSDKFETPAVKAYFQANATCIQAIHDAVRMPECHWSCDYSADWGSMTPHLIRVREAARILAASARMNAHAANHAAAAADIDTIYKLAQLVGKDPLLEAGTTANACAHTADSAIESILAYDPPTTESDLNQYCESLWMDRRIAKRFCESMRGERAVLLRELDQEANRNSSPEVYKSDCGVPNSAYRLLYGSERASMEGAFDDILWETSRSGIPDWMAFQRIVRDNQHGLAGMSFHFMAMYETAGNSFQGIQESASRMQCALAVKAFQLKYNRDPIKLSDVVPEFLPHIPHSAFLAGGFNLKLTVDKKGSDWPPRKYFDGKPVIKIYSFRDGDDDGGKDSNYVIRLAPIQTKCRPRSPHDRGVTSKANLPAGVGSALVTLSVINPHHHHLGCERHKPLRHAIAGIFSVGRLEPQHSLWSPIDDLWRPPADISAAMFAVGSRRDRRVRWKHPRHLPDGSRPSFADPSVDAGGVGLGAAWRRRRDRLRADTGLPLAALARPAVSRCVGSVPGFAVSPPEWDLVLPQGQRIQPMVWCRFPLISLSVPRHRGCHLRFGMDRSWPHPCCHPAQA